MTAEIRQNLVLDRDRKRQKETETKREENDRRNQAESKI